MASIHFSQWPEPVPARRGSIAGAALKAGVPLPHACLAGECGRCKCRLDAGEVAHDPHAPEALSETERAAGLILACRARPRGEVRLTWLNESAAPALKPRRASGKVTSIEPLTHDINRVRVKLGGAPLAFAAGQYARVSFRRQPARAYSMANTPGSEELEFHIRRVPDGQVSGFVAERLRPGSRVELEGPFGDAHLCASARPTTILVGGGSGLAPALSILHALLSAGGAADIHVYHGVRDEIDLYEQERLGRLAAAGAIRYVPVLSSPAGATRRRTGLVHQAVASDFATLAAADLYVCGPPPMVEAVRGIALGRGAAADAIRADPFHAAAPQPARRGLGARLLGWLGHQSA